MPGHPSTWAIVVAAGKGERFGSLKQVALLGGMPLIEWSLLLFAQPAGQSLVDGIVLVVPAGGAGKYKPGTVVDWEFPAYGQWEVDGKMAMASSVPEAPPYLEAGLSPTYGRHIPGKPVVHIVAGGASRSASVRYGLERVPAGAEIIVVHDAGRPLASYKLVLSVINAVRMGAAGAVPVTGVVDTIKEVEGRKVLRTLDRSRLAVVQTPQAFRAGVLRRAHDPGVDATDDAALVEALGEEVVTVPGEGKNCKITTADDLARLDAMIGTGETGTRPSITLRTGQGIDMHRFDSGSYRPGNTDPAHPEDPADLARQADRLVLGGVRIPFHKGLVGHSDADVVTHAVTDALLGAAGLGDIGRHFPDTDTKWSGADSMEMLSQVMAMLRDHSLSVVNADITIIAERPMLSPHIASIQSRLAGVTGGHVNVKATRPEGLGSLGQGEGIACLANVLLSGAP
ncbi:MAG: 2-C-methyl-D-erythritol 2,4-cyclodiphosphate synthase [Actinobacteria bacterium]|nr:2-C-methyl-D-erythritol 2,4-cyclodiphosphate synthase [Actinomycetota bacterium]MCL5447334.1 2-C-methyl-D-erythritol 2,4-cyclodiphosphate synthase [Actinomycetota bacterium]